jgi:uncharacterized GH25 family protein
MKKILSRALIFGVLAVQIGSASAHDVWLTFTRAAASRRAIVNYGHPDDRPPAFADKVVDLQAVTTKGRMSLLTGLGLKTEKGTTVVETKPFVDDEHTLLAARYDNGFWIKLADGTYRNATRRLVPDAADSMWSVKFAKAVTGPDAPWDAVLGQGLEIVPLSDPAKARAGRRCVSRYCSTASRLPAARSSVATGRPSSRRKTFRVSRRMPMGSLRFRSSTLDRSCS